MTTAHAEQKNTEVRAMSAQPNGRAFEIVRDDPIPKPNGKIVDPQGNTVSPATPGLMARLNEKTKDDFTITKGMAGIIAICLTAVGVFLGYVVPTLREGGAESQRVITIEKDIGDTKDQMKDLNRKFDELQKALNQQAINDAVKRGYELKAAEGSHK